MTDAHRVYLTLTGLDGPQGRLSRADMGIAARRALPFPTTGAWFGGLPEHGPVQWLQVPSADAFAAMSCDERHAFNREYERQARLFAPVDVMPGQTGMEI